MSTNKFGRGANDNQSEPSVFGPLLASILLTLFIIGVGICAGYYATEFMRGLVQ